MRRILQLTLSLIILSGCAEKCDETALVVVDGKPLTAAFVKESVLLRAKKNELAGQPIPAAEFTTWGNSTAMKMIGSLTNLKLMEAELARTQIAVSSNDYAATLESYNRQTGLKAATIEELAVSFGDLKAAVMRQYDFAARLHAYSRLYWEIEPSAALVSQYMTICSNQFLWAEKNDTEARHKAEAAYQRLQRGEKWESVAVETSEDALIDSKNLGLAREWCWMTDSAMGMKSLARVLPDMKVGGYTKPLDTPAGMLIVKLLEKKGQLYRVARILFRLSVPVSVPENEKVARDQLAEKLLMSRREATLRHLQSTAHIEYPLGTNFFYKIWKEEK